MVFQAYFLFFLVCTLICIIAIAKNFFVDNLIDKEANVSFWSAWVKFPSYRELVEEHVRSLLVGLYYIQAVFLVILGITAIFGDYSF